MQLRLGVPQHVLIHLCEKGVIAPDFAETSGRGKRREFSERNDFEFAVALTLRDFEMSVATTAFVVRVLRSFERARAKVQTYFLAGRYPSGGDVEKVCDALATRESRSVDEVVAATGVGERRVRAIVAQRARFQFARDGAALPVALGAAFAERRTRDARKLAAMMHYAQQSGCRARGLVAYFGEECGGNCGLCDICRCAY